MGSSIGRQKWGYMIGLKFAQAGQYIEEALRNIGNYILATFTTIFRYLNGKFADFVIPIRNIYFGLVKSFYTGIANIVGLFSDSMEDAIHKALDGLEKVNRKVNELAKIGGGLTAARYDVSEKQLSETKKQSKILKQIAENTEPTKNKTELLMK